MKEKEFQNLFKERFSFYKHSEKAQEWLIKNFDRVKSLVDDFYVFGKSPNKLSDSIINKKLELLKLYESEKPIIDQLLNNNGRWFISNNPDTNYIEFESINRYNKELDKTPYINCYDK